MVKTLPALAKTTKKEYSELECTVEVVRTTEEAIDRIHQFGSSHAVIITDNGKNILLNLFIIRVLLSSVLIAMISRSYDSVMKIISVFLVILVIFKSYSPSEGGYAAR